MLTALVSRVVLSFKIVKYFIILNKKYRTDVTDMLTLLLLVVAVGIIVVVVTDLDVNGGKIFTYPCPNNIN